MSDIFLSYRRSDDPAATRLLQERLTSVFGTAAVFYDVETIPQGEDFVTFIDRTIRACKVVLVVIGPRWLEASAAGQRRLDQPHDPVRVEIETALRLRKKVIPVLVNDAHMPDEDALPVTIMLLHRQNAAPLHTNQYFKPDMDRLIATLVGAGVHPVPEVGYRGAVVAPSRVSRRTVVGLLSVPILIFLLFALVIGGLGVLVFTQLPRIFSGLSNLSGPNGVPTTTTIGRLTLDPPIGGLTCTDKQFQVTLKNGDGRNYAYHVTVGDDPAGHAWATVKGSADGAIAAHENQVITLIPASTLCRDLGGAPKSVTVTVTYAVQGGTPTTAGPESNLTVLPPL